MWRRTSDAAIFWKMTVFGIVIAVVGFTVYAQSMADSVWRELAERLIQLGLVVLIGGGVKLLVDLAREANKEAARRREDRVDFLRRVRACHVRVEYAQSLIRADGMQET